MNTTETAGVKPATDEQIFERLKELSARASEIVGAKCGVSACLPINGQSPYWLVSECTQYASGHDVSFEAACAMAARKVKEYARRTAIEARVRAEMEAGA